jgi:hypothetical protein
VLVSTGVMSNISSQKNARTPEQNISLRNLCKHFWLEETAILDMQMIKLPMISGYDLYTDLRVQIICQRQLFRFIRSRINPLYLRIGRVHFYFKELPRFKHCYDQS